MKKLLLILLFALCVLISYGQIPFKSQKAQETRTDSIIPYTGTTVLLKRPSVKDTLWFPDGSYQVTSSTFDPSLTWLSPVTSFADYTTKTCAVIGDSGYAYIYPTPGIKYQHVFRCDGSSWNEYTPVIGDAVTVIDSAKVFVFDGTVWIASATTSSHWALSGSSLFNTNAGPVGIGTGPPSAFGAKLQVNGSATFNNHISISDTYQSSLSDNTLRVFGSDLNLEGGGHPLSTGGIKFTTYNSTGGLRGEFTPAGDFKAYNNLLVDKNTTLGTSYLQDTVFTYSRQRQYADYDVITANDMLNYTEVNITPLSDDITGNQLNISSVTVNVDSSQIPFPYVLKDVYYLQRNLFNNLNNDSITGGTFGNYNTSINLGGYCNRLYSGYFSSRTTYDDDYPTLTTTTNEMRSLNIFTATEASSSQTLATVNESSGIYNNTQHGGYKITLVTNSYGVHNQLALRARTGATTTITNNYGLYYTIPAQVGTYTAGTRTITNNYGLYMSNTSGVSGSVNDYGIYVSGFRDNWISTNLHIGDTAFLGGTISTPQDTITGVIALSDIGGEDLSNSSNPLYNIYTDTLIVGGDTITGDIDLTDIGNVDLSNSSNPLNTIYCKELSLEEGANAAMGVATLSGGTITVSTTKVTANTRIFLTLQDCSNCGYVWITNTVAGTSFDIQSSNVLDGSVVAWMLVEPN